MAAAVSVGGAKSNNISDEERRWVVVGICLTKVLTPALRDVLANEIPTWYQTLLQPPCEIDKQTFPKHQKKLPRSTLKLNYESINNNTAHKSPHAYDYTVKDPLSLAKLFVKPFMANFTGFDQTMDASAVLSVICEAQPFFVSGAAGIAKKVRSDIRNEWAHCNFSHWTKPNFQAALQSMESLIKKANLTPEEEKKILNELDSWKTKGLQLCFGQPVDPVLLKLIKSEVADLKESIKLWKECKEYDQEILMDSLSAINTGLKQEIKMLKSKQVLTDMGIQDLNRKYTSTCQDIETIQNQLSKVVLRSDESVSYVFRAPQRNPWFSGREYQIRQLKNQLFGKEEQANEERKMSLAAICGLGGSGKTSLVTEYAQRMKDHYQGGVFWISGEDDTKLENSVNDIAMNIGTFLHDSFDVTLSGTLARISRIRRPWLIVVDDMDELHLSPNVMKIISGSWQQQGVAGHVVITTRRKPSALANDVRYLQESSCVQLECFDPEEAKNFLFTRTGIQCNDETDPVADSLVAELGGLPLALEQAGAFIKSLRCSLSSYLESYKAQCLRLLTQKMAATRVSEYESPEKLAVTTTWLINLEHIRQSIDGENAILFLNACAFSSPNEIQPELFNVGEPFVEDEQFREFVSTPLGCQKVLKLLTDFSLFKESDNCCLSVHRLVQEVIIENLSPDDKAESFVNAVRFLHYAFLKCPSPDELLTSMADRQRVSVNSTDPFRFHQWSKLCLHSHEILKNVEKFVKQSPKRTEKKIFFLETARIVYECALHLSVNCRQEEAKQTLNFAYRILDWAVLGKRDVSKEKLQGLFAHIVPLPVLVRRHILYSCKDPSCVSNTGSYTSSEQIPIGSEQSEYLGSVRLEGNRLFEENRYEEAVVVYSSAINTSKGTNLFDPTLFSNRASAYLKLKQYDNALKDAEDYIEKCPECWKGYARKALALDGLNEKLTGKCFAALAFCRESSVFRKYTPFKVAFSDLEECIYVCDSSSQLMNALESSSLLELGKFSNEIKRIIILEPGKYVISSRDLKCSAPVDEVVVRGCILWGNVSLNSNVCLNFKEDCRLNIMGYSAASNIDFAFDQGFCNTTSHSVVKLSNCSFTNDHKQFPVYQVSAGIIEFDCCCFKNCKAGGLVVVDSGLVEVRNCVCSGNGSAGLEVRQGGCLVIKDCDSYGNRQGLLIGPSALKCSLFNSQIHDNKLEGIMVNGKSSGVVLSDNRVFDNDQYGISVTYSAAIIERNAVFDNCAWGIWIQSNSLCRISHNNVYRNKVGGIRVGKRQCPDGEEMVVEFNKIFDNGGPGIDEMVLSFDVFPMRNYNINLGAVGDVTGDIPDLKNAKCRGNELTNNKELSGQKTAASVSQVKYCSYCLKEEDLQKCGKCFTAEYCGKDCQKSHWKTHRNICSFYLEQFSFVTYLTSSLCFVKASTDRTLNHHHQDLEPIGPVYCSPPKNDGRRFIVKVQNFERPFHVNTNDLRIYDRSMTVDGHCESSCIGNLIREYGEICQRRYVEKKLFFWALYCEDGKIRIFTNEFAPSQRW